MLPAGGGWLYVETGGATRAEARGGGARRSPRRCRGRRRWSSATRRRSGRCGGSGRTGRASSPAARTATRPGRAGRTPPCRPSGSAPTCGSSTRCCASTAAAGAYYGHFGDGCLHIRIDFDLLTTAGRRRLPLVHGGRGGPGRRARRLALGRARRRGGPRRAAAAHVPAGDHRRVRGVQGHLGPGRPDEPRPRRAAREAGRGPAGVRRDAQPARDGRRWRSPKTAARSPGPAAAAWASGGASRRPAA